MSASGDLRRLGRDLTGRRFVGKVVRGPVPDDASLGACLLWTGAVSKAGYGTFRVDSDQVRLVHVWIYETLIGPIPAGQHVDHVCHDYRTCQPDDGGRCPHRRCVNPRHLVARTPAQNNERSGSPSAVNARKTYCDHDHALTENNVYHPPGRPTARYCRECADERRAAYERNRRMLTASMAKRRASRAPGPDDVPLFSQLPGWEELGVGLENRRG